VTILSLISSEGHYGVENMLVTLDRSLSRRGCRCIVGVFDDSRFPHKEVAQRAECQGLPVEIIPCRGRLDYRAVKHIRKLIAHHDVDVLHPHGYKADLYAYAANRPGRVPLVATVHNWPSRLPSMRLYAALDRLVLRRFDKVAAVSDPAARILARWGVAGDKLCTILNAVDIERYRNATPTLSSEIGQACHALVGFVGRLVPSKGGSSLLRAAQRVLSRNPEVTFVLVGDGPSRKDWETLAAELGISGRVRFTGTRNDMPGVYASLDVVVLPSEIESMPMCVLEAMAAGKPVIATPVGAVPQLVASEETGLLVETGSVDALANAILRLVDDRDFARQLGENGYQRAAKQFSADTMAESYLSLYRQLFKSPIATAPLANVNE